MIDASQVRLALSWLGEEPSDKAWLGNNLLNLTSDSKFVLYMSQEAPLRRVATLETTLLESSNS